MPIGRGKQNKLRDRLPSLPLDQTQKIPWNYYCSALCSQRQTPLR